MPEFVAVVVVGVAVVVVGVGVAAAASVVVIVVVVILHYFRLQLKFVYHLLVSRCALKFVEDIPTEAVKAFADCVCGYFK